MLFDNNIFDKLLFSQTGGYVDLEHTLILMLILVGLLSHQRKNRRIVPWIIAGGVVLALFTPVQRIMLSWPLISALVLPPLLWQVSIRLAIARPVIRWQNVTAWLLTTLFIGISLILAADLPPPNAFLLSLLASSLIWQVHEHQTGSTDLGVFGPLTLALLLVEVDVLLHPLGSFLGSLFTGVGLGLILGIIAAQVAVRIPIGKKRFIYYFALAYVSYLIGSILGTSGIAMAISTGLVLTTYSYSTGKWTATDEIPFLLNNTWIFALLAGAWLFMSWQAHVPVTQEQLIASGVGVTAAALSILIRRIYQISTRNYSGRSFLNEFFRKERKVLLLILGALLVWPRQAVLDSLPLVTALIAAFVLILILRIALDSVFELMGVELRMPKESSNDE